MIFKRKIFSQTKLFYTMKKSSLTFVILILFSITFVRIAYGQTNQSNSSNASVQPLYPSSADSVYVYYSYTSTDACPDFFLQRDSVSRNRVYVSLRKITDQGRICAQVITRQTAKLNLGLFKVDTEVYMDRKLLATVKMQCTPDKEGVVVTCNNKLYIQEYSPLAVMQLYLIENTELTVRLKPGDKVKFGGLKISQDPNIYAPCSVVGIAKCIILTEPAEPPCVKDRKGVVVLCNRRLLIKEITSATDTASVREPRLYEFENTYTTDADGVTKPALSVNDRVIFGATIYENTTDTVTQCKTTGKVKCFERVYDAPECVLNKEGVVVKYNNELFIEEFSIAAVAIKQLYAIKLNSNLVLKEGDRVKFGGYTLPLDSVNSAAPYLLVGVALCARVIETSPPPCMPDRIGEVVVCANQLFIRETTYLTDSANEVYRLFIFENPVTVNADGSISKLLSVGDKVKFSTVILTVDTIKNAECKIAGKAVCIKLIVDTPDCELNRKGKVISCNNQLFISEHTDADAINLQLYAFRNGGNFETLKEGDIVVFGAVKVRPDSANTASYCRITGIAQCWKILEHAPECILNRKGVIEQGVDGCQGRLFIRETDTRRLFAIALKNTDNAGNVTLTGLRPGYKVIFGGYLTGRDSSQVSLCYTDGVALCLKVTDTNTGCELNRKGIIVKGTNECEGRVFVKEITTGNLYVMYNYDGIYRTENYTVKLNEGDHVIFGAVERNIYTDQYEACKAVGVVLCYQLISSAKTASLKGYALTPEGKLGSGRAVLLPKGGRKALAVSKIVEGYFEFNNIPAAVYTVYVIPAYPELMKYVPTFYTDKLYYRYADFIEVNTDSKEIFVKMRYHERKTGTARIYGNIHFEYENLNDSLMIKNSLGDAYTSTDFNLAVDVPVLLLDNTGETTAWTITDAFGNYVFENIPTGVFRLYTETSSAIGNKNIEITAEQNDVKVDLVLKNSETNTGINDKLLTEIAVYPVPAKNKLSVVLSQNEIISLYDVRGQLVHTQQAFTGVNEIDITSIMQGIIVLKVGNTTIKIVKE